MFGGGGDFDVVMGWRAEAIADYDQQTPEEISFAEGDSIAVEVQNENGWWVGTNRRTKQRGIFPGSYVEVDGPMKVKVPKSGGGGGGGGASKSSGGAPGMGGFDSESAINAQMDKAIARARVASGDVDPQLWDWGNIDRDNAVRVLQGHSEGTFLVRSSTSQANSYSISVVQNGQVRHIRINSVPGGYSINAQDRPAPTLGHLVAAKMGEKLKSSLQGTGQSVESRLLVAPLPNPQKQQQLNQGGGAPPQAQAPAQPVQQLTQQMGGFGLAAPPSAKRSNKTNDPYARQRGQQGQVAATSQIKMPDANKIGQSRVLKNVPGGPQQDPFAAQGGGDPFAPAGGAPAPAPAPVPAPVPVQQAPPPQQPPAGAAPTFLQILQSVWTKAGPVDNKLGGAQLRFGYESCNFLSKFKCLDLSCSCPSLTTLPWVKSGQWWILKRLAQWIINNWDSFLVSLDRLSVVNH
eukprot:m.245240 g.245240  ORF g.245240 m.245240 type:complete len:462 (+) comp16107_c1_seq1:177-1562(+)